MACGRAAAALTDLIRGLDDAVALARRVPAEDHRQPPQELIDLVSRLARQTSAVGDLVANELPRNPPLDALLQHPRTVWSQLITDLGDCVALLESGCDRELRLRALCYEPLLETLRAEADNLAALLAPRP